MLTSTWSLLEHRWRNFSLLFYSVKHDNALGKVRLYYCKISDVTSGLILIQGTCVVFFSGRAYFGRSLVGGRLRVVSYFGNSGEIHVRERQWAPARRRATTRGTENKGLLFSAPLPDRIAITTSTELHRQLIVHAAGCSILCSIHSADETQPGRNSCPEFAIFGFQFGLYHVGVTLSFSLLRSVSLAVVV